MKHKRDAGVVTRGAGASGSSSSSSGGKLRKTASKDTGGGGAGTGGKKKSVAASRLPMGRKPKPANLTAVRVAHIISQLDNKRGSTMESIRSKLIRSGYKTNTSLIRSALDRAVKTGLLREIREERFSLPTHRTTSNTNSSSSNTSSTRTGAGAKVARRLPSKGQHRKLTVSSSRSYKPRQRRPPQGRRLANGENGADDDDDIRDMHDDDDTGLGDGDVEAESSGNMAKNPNSSRVSVAEPVAGCDAVMVFGTH